MSHYMIRPSIREQLPEVIAAAYRAAGLIPPNQGADLVALLQAEDTAEQVALDLAAESVEVTDADAWTEEAIARIQRAQAADLLLKAVRGHRTHAMKTKGGMLIRQATADLNKPFTAAVKKLTAAARQLPAGNDPLNLEAAVATDTTKARREAGQALALLGGIASVLGTQRAGDLHVQFRDLLYVVDVPAVPVAYINRLTRETVNPDPVRDEVRRLAHDAERHSLDRALIGVARGEYGDAVTFQLATSPTDISDRIERGRVATSALPVDTNDSRPRTSKPMTVKV